MRQLLLKIAHKIIHLLGNENKPEPLKEETILENVFNTNFNKRVLISYLKQPFIEGIKYHHTNYLECFTAAEIFKELGYDVDVIDLFYNKPDIDFGKYDVIYGMGAPLENSFYFDDTEKIFKVLYSTGFTPFYSNEVSLKRVNDFYLKNKLLIPESSRATTYFWPCTFLLSDLVIALGNSIVSDSFYKTNDKINCKFLNAFYIETDVAEENILQTENDNSLNKDFLWFGSIGLIHKGLDLVLDYFLNRKDLNVHICGDVMHEKKFWNFYKPKIEQSNNIFIHGYVDIKSNLFKEIINRCSFILFPTASEGGSPSLLNVMANGGLIPITSNNCGIDLNEFGLILDKLDIINLGQKIDEILLMENEEIEIKKNKIKFHFGKEYTLKNYKNNLKELLSNEIFKFKNKIAQQ